MSAGLGWQGSLCLALTVALLAMPQTPALAQTVAVARGKAIAEAKCAGCHAVGRTDSSRKAGAPLFRELSRRYPIETLAEPLAEGIVTGHAGMPEFRFAAPDVAALLAYLESINAPRKP